jgi:hypothetical protein
MNVRSDLRLELCPLILAVGLVAALPLEAQQKGQYVRGQGGLNAGYCHRVPKLAATKRLREARSGEGIAL